MTGSETHTPVTIASVSRIVWRQKSISAVVFLLIAVIGTTIVLVRPKTYESSSSIALLPDSVDTNILQNYPNLITSLIPTYVQLVSSPALLDQVAAGLPFHTSGQTLAGEVSAQSLSSAAVINIVAHSSNPTQARQIATEATKVFVSQLQDNGVVVPTIYGLPSATPALAPPHTSTLLALVLVLAVVLALGAGLIWDRLAAAIGPSVALPTWTSVAEKARAAAGKVSVRKPSIPERSLPGSSDGGTSIGDNSESAARSQP